MFANLDAFWTWFTTPTIHPFAGVVAAIVAALTIQPLSWLNPFRALRRLVQVVLLWLLIVWVIAFLPLPGGVSLDPGNDTWHVRPYVGATAAVLAALSIRLVTWFNLVRATRRVVQVAGVWLLIVWLVVMNNGQGFGWGGGRGQGGIGNQTGAGPGDYPGELVSSAGAVVVPGEFPAGLSPNVVLQVRFVPLGTDSAIARDYAADVLIRASNQTVQIRTATMIEFKAELTSVLRAAPLPEKVRNPLVSVVQTPFPGTGILQMVEALLRETLPRLGLQREQSP